MRGVFLRSPEGTLENYRYDRLRLVEMSIDVVGFDDYKMVELL